MNTNNYKSLKCCFLGHRKVENKDRIVLSLKGELIKLIQQADMVTFLFGSKSEFDDICHQVVTELKQLYPNIKRVAYICKSEWACLEQNRETNEHTFSELTHEKIFLKGYEEVVKLDRVCDAGKASYIERNQAMINDSDICFFYYNDNYLSGASKKSGTKIAFDYAVKLSKKRTRKLLIKNLYKM